MKILRTLLALTLALPAWAGRNFEAAAGSRLSTETAVADVPMTFACFFRPNLLTTTGVLVGIFATNDDGHYLMFRGATAGDPLSASSNDSGVSAAEAVTGTSGITSGVWYHGAAVYAATNDRRVFLDGVKSTNSTNVTPSGFVRTSVGAFMGAANSTFFDGDIAEVAIWNVALTDDEIASLSRGLSPLKVRPASLVFYVPLWRDVFDYRASLSITSNNTVPTETHPRRYR